MIEVRLWLIWQGIVVHVGARISLGSHASMLVLPLGN